MLARLFLLGLLVTSIPALADDTVWLLDGSFADWPADATTVNDPVGDDPRGQGERDGRDIVRMLATLEATRLNLAFEFDAVEDADAEAGLLLLIDGDRDPGTGRRLQGLGCELVYDIGNRVGEIHVDGVTRTFGEDDRLHELLGVLVAPTVTSKTLEVVLPRTMADGSTLFRDPRGIHLVVYDERSDDRVPDDGSLTLLWKPEDRPVTPIPLERAPGADVRVANYNIEHDGLFETDDAARQDALRRILGVIDADVWIFNEVWDHDAEQVRARLGELLGRDLSDWGAVRHDSGNVLLSRFPVRQSWEVIDDVESDDPRDRHRVTAALLGTPRRDALFVANHWRCCANDAMRQVEADATVRFLRDALTRGGRIEVMQDTPFVLTGDFNLVGLREQLDTVMTGDIVDETRFGPDRAPDWDGTPLEAVALRHVEQPYLHTWHVPDSRFAPGRLDWIFVSDSVVAVERAYVLDTTKMSPVRLEAAGLRPDDSRLASDHFPLVADLRWR